MEDDRLFLVHQEISVQYTDRESGRPGVDLRGRRRDTSTAVTR
ncbi:hypothetical protein [Streptomyces sp. NPDC096193]